MTAKNVPLGWAILAGVFIGAYACSDSPSGPGSGTTPRPAPVAAVHVSAPAGELIVGATLQLAAAVTDARGNTLTDREIVWSSNSAATATVSSKGLITGIAPGNVRVSATADGVAGHFDLAVKIVPVALVEIAPAADTLFLEQTHQFEAVLRDAAGSILIGRDVRWTNLHPDVATVSDRGVVTAVGVGTAKIVAASEGKADTAEVVVKERPVATVVVVPAVLDVQVGETQALKVLVMDSTGRELAGRAIAWKSSDTGVVTVSPDGLVSVVGTGEAEVVATVEGVTGVCRIAARRPPTRVSGILNTNTTWSKESSPYEITSKVQVAPGATLTIQPGVRVSGDSIEVFGTLRAIGTATDSIRFTGTTILPAEIDVAPTVHVEYAEISGGEFMPRGIGTYTVLRHSTLKDVRGVTFVFVRKGASYIEWNALIRSAGIRIIITDSDGKVYLRHNSFREPQGRGYFDSPKWAIEVGIAYSTSGTVIQNNNFWSTDRVNLWIGNSGAPLTVTATQNYWGTIDEAVIASMIRDKNDDLSSGAYVEFRPYLTSPDPEAP